MRYCLITESAPLMDEDEDIQPENIRQVNRNKTV